ncbi:MAG: hypothetical protein M3Z10_10005 [Gemmatimonadota bacterium]|nr:hypothetical protein [Gemmatimonadota bacterium]
MMSDGISDYRIEKFRRRVEVTLGDGRRLDGDVFVQAVARLHEGPEDPLDLLDNDDLFLPLVMPTGEAFLVQKTQIAVVGTTLPDGDDALDRGVVGMRIECTLIDGSSHVGSIFPEVRANRKRLIDILNDLEHRFVPLFTADQLRLVSRLHIAYVRPVS